MSILGGGISIYQTIHIMVEKIDAGKILYEKEYIFPDDITLIGAYAEVFKDTANCYYQGILNLLDNKIIEQDNSKRVYRTHPNAAECKEFKKYFKIVKIKELFDNFGYRL